MSAIFLDSKLTAPDILEFGFEHVCIATGSRWRRNGMGVSSFSPFDGHDGDAVFTPDDVMAGAEIDGRVLVYDDDHFYLGGVIAETLRARGNEVMLVTSADNVSPHCSGTLDQARIQARLIDLGVEIVTARMLTGFSGTEASLACTYSGNKVWKNVDAVVTVTSRDPDDGLYRQLADQPDKLKEAGIVSLKRIGDCEAPNIIAAAVHAGHLYARTLDGEDIMKRDRVIV